MLNATSASWAQAISERTQLGGAAQDPVGEESVDHGVAAVRGLGVQTDEIVRYRAAEPVSAAIRIETQQMPAVYAGFADPKLADRAAVDQRFMHRGSSSSRFNVFSKTHSAASPSETENFETCESCSIDLYIAVQHEHFKGITAQ